VASDTANAFAVGEPSEADEVEMMFEQYRANQNKVASRVGRQLAEAVADAVREPIEDAIREAILDELGGDEVKEEIDRHIREAVQSSDLATKEVVAVNFRVEEVAASVVELEARVKDTDESITQALTTALDVTRKRFEKLEDRFADFDDTAEASALAFSARISKLDADYDRQMSSLIGVVESLSEAVSTVQALEDRRQDTPWRRLCRFLRGGR
jgi:polyhydroxyalkanoate synthesis regulator phasin